MNKLEEKCSLLAKTPQARWYDLRFKPTIQLLMNMNEDGIISLRQFDVPLFKMLNIIIYAFKYDGEFYFLFINQIGKVTEFYHLERTNSLYDHMLSSHIVISSDDDPHQETYIPTVAMAMGFKSNSEFISKLKSIL